MSITRLIALSAILVGVNVRDQRPSAPPTTRFIETEPGVKVEVLDWGGTGRAVILVAGYGRTAHDFDTFGPALSSTYHAYSVTRRGFGASSKPASGYSADRLGDDVLAVIDSLGLVAPILAGHSLGGEELSSIGTRHPEKIGGLVYLDAAYGYAFYDEGEPIDRHFIDRNEVVRGLRQLTIALEAGNAEEVHRVIAKLTVTDLPALQRTLRDMDQRTPSVSASPATSFTMPVRPGIDQMVFEGLQRHTAVRAPVLAIYALKGMADSVALREWRSGTRHEIIALKRGAPNARVVIYPDAGHDVFRSNEADVLREMRAFVDGLARGDHLAAPGTR